MKKKRRHSLLFFPSVFVNSGRTSAAWSSELKDHDCVNKDFPFVDAERIRDQLHQLNIRKSTRSGGIHSRILKEIENVAAELLSTISQRTWESGETPADWKIVNTIPVYKKGMRKDPRNCRPVSQTSVPGKNLEIIPASTERH